jgi:hypothetical protein
MTVRGREIGWGPVDQSVGVMWIRMGAFFLRTVDPFNSVDDYVKGCHTWTARDMYVSESYSD